MGLIKDAMKLRKQREFAEMCEAVFGMSIEEIKKSLEDKRVVYVKEEAPVVDKDNKDEQVEAENKQKALEKMTPEQMVEQFAGDVEEFYPDGNAPTKH